MFKEYILTKENKALKYSNIFLFKEKLLLQSTGNRFKVIQHDLKGEIFNRQLHNFHK